MPSFLKHRMAQTCSLLFLRIIRSRYSPFAKMDVLVSSGQMHDLLSFVSLSGPDLWKRQIPVVDRNFRFPLIRRPPLLPAKEPRFQAQRGNTRYFRPFTAVGRRDYLRP